MVKQLDNGYFINGAWYLGRYHDVIKPELLEHHNKPIILKATRTIDTNEPLIYTGNEWSEPIGTPYLQYLLYGVIAVLLFVLILSFL